MPKRCQASGTSARSRRGTARKSSNRQKVKHSATNDDSERRKLKHQLSTALQQQTATAEVLRTVSGSSFNLQAVLDKLVETAMHLCDADSANIWRPDGEVLTLAASCGHSSEFTEFAKRNPIRLGRETVTGRVFLDGTTVNIADVLSDPQFAGVGYQSRGRYRTHLGVPLLRDGKAIGAFALTRSKVRPYSQDQVELAETFASQAVLAIENARLISELRDRAERLARSAVEMRALEDVAQTISSSIELDVVLSTIVTKAVELSGTDAGAIYVYDDTRSKFEMRATFGLDQETVASLRRYGIGLDEPHIAQAFAEADPIQITDLRDSPPSSANKIILNAGYRSLLVAPLSRSGSKTGFLVIRRRAPGTFPPDTIRLIKTLSAQSVLPIRNAQLFHNLEKRTLELAEDNAQRKKIEEALRANRQLLENVLENSPGVIYAKRADGRYTYINHEWEVVCGFTREQVIGKTDFDLFPQAIAEQFRTNDITAMNAGRVIQSEERINSAGSEQIFLSKKVPLVSNSGEVEGLCGISANITDIRRTELALREAKTLAEEATKSKSEFLANMSHEIRTPLNAIIGLSHLSLTSELSARQRDYVSKIHGAGVSLLELINGILDFSKVEAGKLELEVSQFKLDTVLQNVLTFVGQKAQDKGLELLFDISSQIPPLLLGDPLRLGQIVMNLLGNAVKFTDQGEVRLAARIEQQDGERVKLRFLVSDSGIGMNEEAVQRLFRPFAQADSSTTRKYGGTGLGLAISKNLVELMGGTIQVKSLPDVGSTFSFDVWLGIADNDAPQEIVPARLSDLKVLVVDDNDSAREILEKLLRGLGATVSEAASGPEAIEAVKVANGQRQFDLVLLDWRMPTMDGVETARRIQLITGLKNKPALVIVTAFGGAEVRVKAEDAGIDHVLIKPVTPSMLVDTLVELFIPQHHKLAVVDNGSPAFDLTGLRVLLAEDNKINQQIAIELLERAGASVEVANNGREILEKLPAKPAKPNFDLVLMDLQMPEMDGYQATAKIRAIPHLSDLPIIALTAHAFSEERDRCLAAGMQGHISKPIEPEILYRTLLEHRQPEAKTKHTNTNIIAAQQDVAIPVIHGIDTTDGLRRVGGNIRLYRALLKQFAEDHAVTELQTALKKGDYTTAAQVAHTVRGMAGNIGARTLSGLAEQLERCLQLQDANGITKQAGLLSAERQTIVRSIRLYDDRPPQAPTASTVAAADVASLFACLRQMLESNDGQSLDYLLEIRDRLGTATTITDLDTLQGLVAQYEFAAALDCLNRIANHATIE